MDYWKCYKKSFIRAYIKKHKSTEKFDNYSNFITGIFFSCGTRKEMFE